MNKFPYDDYTFAIFCWTLVLTPAILAIVHWHPKWLLFYIPVALIFGLA